MGWRLTEAEMAEIQKALEARGAAVSRGAV
jgi:hypothetical protein